ncbi:MAG: hypothetical protein IPL43_09435 [Micropruina sp.]|nr:hypothetical protein [Micropruina sp.]
MLGALLAVGGSPWLVRTLRRRRRLGAVAAADRVEGAWEEFRDLVWDAGWEWPTGSVRESGRHLAERLPDGADAAIKELATWVERSRYADSLGTVPALTDQVTTVRDALARTRRSGRVPWREVLPRSIWKRFRWSRGA